MELRSKILSILLLVAFLLPCFALPIKTEAEEMTDLPLTATSKRNEALLKIKDFLVTNYKDYLEMEEELCMTIEDKEAQDARSTLIAEEKERISYLEKTLDKYFEKLLEEEEIMNGDLDTISSLIKPLTQKNKEIALEKDRLAAFHKSFLSLNKGLDYIEQFKVQEESLFRAQLDESVELLKVFYTLEQDVFNSEDESFSACLEYLRTQKMKSVKEESAKAFAESIRGLTKAMIPDQERRVEKVKEAFNKLNANLNNKSLATKIMMELEAELSQSLDNELMSLKKSFKAYFDEILQKVLLDLEDNRFELTDALKLKALSQSLVLLGDLSAGAYAFGLELNDLNEQDFLNLGTGTRIAYLSKRVLPEREVFVLTEASLFKINKDSEAYLFSQLGSDRSYFREGEAAYHGIVMELFKRAARLPNN